MSACTVHLLARHTCDGCSGKMYPYAGNYSVWLEKKSARLDLESKQDRRRQKAMEEELQWIRRGARVRLCVPLSGPAAARSTGALACVHGRVWGILSVGAVALLCLFCGGVGVVFGALWQQAQQAKSKARVAAYDSMVDEAERIRLSQKFVGGVITIPPAPRLGPSSLLTVHVTHAWLSESRC